MINPSIEKAKSLCAGNTVIPICLELFSDIKTPIEVLRRFKEKSERCYLLESVEGGEKWSRYSFLGYEPKLLIKCKDGTVDIEDCITKSHDLFNDIHPNDVLRQVVKKYQSPQIDGMPPFTGGLVGYVSYDFIKYNEKRLMAVKNNEADFDDLNLMLFDKVIVFDHLCQKIILIVNIETEDLENNYIEGVIALKEIENIIKSDKPALKFKSRLLSDFNPLFSSEQYCAMVEKTKKHIFEGDIFQAVISNRQTAAFEGDLLPTYRALRTINPSPYMFYISMGDIQIAGASPETLISLKKNKLSTFPIAGTCRRGETDEEDERLICELLNDEKETAEHDMLVDLGRNDLGRISEMRSVHVGDYRKVLKFSHVMHITSTLTGNLKKGLDSFDALSAILPAGTLSGAPKIRACEIINELEGNKRGIYGGAIGYIDFTGNMDFCIAIRFAVKKGDNIYVQSGAGIVADSIPERENEECANKAKAMLYAIKISQEVEK
ncbi:MAG: anthranilate synthase component I [Saccharofermentanales bacterium]